MFVLDFPQQIFKHKDAQTYISMPVASNFHVVG